MYTTFARRIGTAGVLEVYWYDQVGCRQHKASATLHKYDSTDPDDYEDWRWPEVCDVCDQRVPKYCVRKVAERPIYDTPSGELEPGCIYWNTDLPEDFFWDDHKGPHLAIVAPNGFRWVLDSRAKNCRRPGDSKHRCWQWEGDPEVPGLSVVQDSFSCSPNPSGVVKLGSWTGKLHSGKFYTVPVTDGVPLFI